MWDYKFQQGMFSFKVYVSCQRTMSGLEMTFSTYIWKEAFRVGAEQPPVFKVSSDSAITTANKVAL